jgi:AcrR family transcriptional regulator
MNVKLVVTTKKMSNQNPTKPGLRERKKAETRLAISDVATRLFIERGFESVTVAEVAEAANVSVNTVFNYFPSKEELFFDRGREVRSATSRAIRARKHGESAVAALRRDFRKTMKGEGGRLFAQRVRPFVETIERSPALQARARLLIEESEHELVDTLIEETRAARDDATARAVAAMIVGVQGMVLREFRQRLMAGDPDQVLRSAVSRLAERGFELLLGAAGDYAVRA